MVEQLPNPLAPPAGGHSYLISVDGSEASELAFKISMKGLFRPEKDVFNVCTITNHNKTDLPFIYKPEYIEEKYQAKIYANAKSGTARFIKKELEPERTTKETLWMVAQAYQADIIVCGMHGRKGPKADFTVAGSAVQFLAQQPITVAILKDTNMHPIKDHYRFGVCYDGSAGSQSALRKTVSMAADHDKVTIISVIEKNVDEASIERKVAEICAGRAHDCITLRLDANQTVQARIKQYLIEQAEDDSYIDFISVGQVGLGHISANRAGGSDFLGSVARAMISMRKLNCIYVPQ